METHWTIQALLAAALLFGAGCKKAQSVTGGPPGPVTALATNSYHLDRAQPKLPTMKLWLGSQELITEIARTPTQQATGMMFRTQMAENEAMLFVFPRPHQASFYMRNTLVPLSCAYIDPDGVILEIHDMKPKDETSIEAATDQVQFVLEVKQGWFQRNNVGSGAVVRTEKGSLLETFFGPK
jgi:uncharacterized membrane protein (UPF0127 family)